MFGYINVNREKLNTEDAALYQSYYCGLCRELKEQFGRKGQMLLNYDMTFLIVLLTGLYELEDEKMDFVCPIHPAKPRTARCNEATHYAADMNILLSSGNFDDDWKDNHSYTKKALSRIFKKDYERIRKKYPRQEHAVSEYLRRLDIAEMAKERNVDIVAGLTGEMLAEIFAWKDGDIWSDELKCLGFYMGKFIYLMDAYEDMIKDEKNRNYNVLALMQHETKQDIEVFSKLMLTSMMAECAKSFERLPVLLHAEICRNVLYSGVWTKYEYLRIKKQTKLEKQGKKQIKLEKQEKRQTKQVKPNVQEKKQIKHEKQGKKPKPAKKVDTQQHP